VPRPRRHRSRSSAIARKRRRSPFSPSADHAARADRLSSSANSSSRPPNVVASRKPRNSRRMRWRRNISELCSGRVEPPGCTARVCGHLPASSPIACMKRARAGSTSFGALPTVEREALHRAGVPAPTLVVVAREVRHEEKVEMRQVVGQVFRRQCQVGGQAAVARRRDTGGIGQRQRGGGRLRHRADAADARHQHQRIGRQLALQDLLEAPIQRRIDARRDDALCLDVERDFEVALDAIEGPHYTACVHFFARLTEGARS
jgi:hypothetical protein